MIRGASPIYQALLGSLLTWGLTALGSAGVFFFNAKNRSLLDGSLGFAAGVMSAASFWSLLAPALELTEKELGSLAFIPAAVGFICGAAFVYLADVLLSKLGFSGSVVDELKFEETTQSNDFIVTTNNTSSYSYESQRWNEQYEGLRMRSGAGAGQQAAPSLSQETSNTKENRRLAASWKRIFLLLIAIVVHNIPEGLVVGVGFGAVGSTPAATFESAVTLAIGIGIQNFPEGLAVSLPLAGFGYGKLKSFWYGQLSGAVEPLAALLGAAAVTMVQPLLPYALSFAISGAVEPLAALLGAAAVTMVQPLLPYALSFAAGAMFFVVVDDIIPECQAHGRLASWTFIVGFVVMMSLDVGLG